MGKRKGSLGKTPGLDFLTVIALIAAAIVALFPVLWGLSTALKTDSAVTMFPPEIIPKEITWNNFIDVVTKSDFMIYMKNSLLITLISIVMATFVAAHAAYALTFFNIRFRKGISFFILMTSMVPPVALLVPLYMLSVTESVQYKNSSGSDLYGVEDTCAYLDHGRIFPKTSYGNCRGGNH